jgi:predicted house-cleaning NTP pyrophosphatase (Maf/HAM1 superfamily)
LNSPVLYLASNSPRRRQLLALAGWDFIPWPADIDETPLDGEAPADYVLRLAEAKARSAARGVPQAGVILAADTTVVDPNPPPGEAAILGKPRDAADAAAMLRRLRGRVHQVYTAIAAMRSGVDQAPTDRATSPLTGEVGPTDRAAIPMMGFVGPIDPPAVSQTEDQAPVDQPAFYRAEGQAPTAQAAVSRTAPPQGEREVAEKPVAYIPAWSPDGKVLMDVCVSHVPMRAYSDEEIQAYAASGDPLDKAGAYAIQHAGFHPVENFTGCTASVMGLPLCHTAHLLELLGVPPGNGRATACLSDTGLGCPAAELAR